MRIGIFGGTFDPIHFGHLNLAACLMEKAGLDQVWFCPARYSPHKVGKEVSGVHDRLEMVKRAIRGDKRYKAVDFEIKRDGPSYTVDTLEDLHKKYPDDKFYLIIGNDSVNGFFKWRDPGRIVELASLLVGTRDSKIQYTFPPGADPKVAAAIKEGVVETDVVDISSTEVRERVKRGESIRGLVPENVIDYLIEHRLYSSN